MGWLGWEGKVEEEVKGRERLCVVVRWGGDAI